MELRMALMHFIEDLGVQVIGGAVALARTIFNS